MSPVDLDRIFISEYDPAVRENTLVFSFPNTAFIGGVSKENLGIIRGNNFLVVAAAGNTETSDNRRDLWYPDHPTWKSGVVEWENSFVTFATGKVILAKYADRDENNGNIIPNEHNVKCGMAKEYCYSIMIRQSQNQRILGDRNLQRFRPTRRPGLLPLPAVGHPAGGGECPECLRRGCRSTRDRRRIRPGNRLRRLRHGAEPGTEGCGLVHAGFELVLPGDGGDDGRIRQTSGSPVALHGDRHRYAIQALLPRSGKRHGVVHRASGRTVLPAGDGSLRLRRDYLLPPGDTLLPAFLRQDSFHGVRGRTVPVLAKRPFRPSSRDLRVRGRRQPVRPCGTPGSPV